MIVYAFMYMYGLTIVTGVTTCDEYSLELIDLFEGEALYEGNELPLRCSYNPNTPPCDPVDYLFYEKKVGDTFEKALQIKQNNEVVTYTLSNGYNLTGRVRGDVFDNEFGAFFKNVILEDSGEWRCKENYCLEDAHCSNTLEFYVSTQLKPTDISITQDPDDYILLGSPSTYTCQSARVYPQVDMFWNIDGKDIDNTTTKYTPNGIAWSLININSFTFFDQQDKVVECIIEKTTGLFTWNVSNNASQLTKYAPAAINASTVSPKTPELQDELKLVCTAYGTNITVTWKRNDIAISDDLFTIEAYDIPGDFPFGEKSALEVTGTWKPPAENAGCGDINKHNGNYKCVATAAKGPEAVSKIDEVKVNYAPILEKPDDEVFDRMIGETVTMTCSVECAEPGQVTYTWTSENDRDGTNQNTDTISFGVGEDDFNVTFTCHVNNSVDAVSKSFTIHEIVTPAPPTTQQSTEPIYTYTDGNITSPTVDPGSGKRNALIIANAVIWSLCGVVGVVLVCLALYHYRQIQNGKKRQEYSDNTPLTEDEAKPGSSNITSEYADISLAGAIGGVSRPVSGLHTEDMYAEIPVAPKRTSKEKAHQPQQGTPKIKPNQSPAVPNSPLNPRRQEPNNQIPDRQPEPAADYSPSNKRKDIPTKHSNAVKNDTGAKVDKRHRKESPNQQAIVKPNTNGAKPPVSAKPNITSFRSSRSNSGGLTGQDKNPEGPNYDNPEVNLYANCEQHQVPKNSDGTITYADLALQQEDPYEEGAPPVPKKNMTDQEPVQYASIKRSK